MKIEEIAKEIANKQQELRTSGLAKGDSLEASEIRRKYILPLMRIHRELKLLEEMDKLLYKD